MTSSTIVISAKVDQGLSISNPNGEPLSLAVIDQHGNIISSGSAVTKAVFNAAVKAYDDFWQGNGHLTTLTNFEITN